jgi:hypothetical protein
VKVPRSILVSGLFLAVLTLSQGQSAEKGAAPEKSFPQSVSAVKAALQALPGGTSGTLPLLEGFVDPSVVALDQYQRPFYRCKVSVQPEASGGSRVRVSASITAWHKAGAKPGYEVLPSSGRLESDLLDRLEQSLAASQPPSSPTPGKNESASNSKKATSEKPLVSAPSPQFPKHFDVKAAPPTTAADPALQREAENLEEIFRNQAHPTNLVAVKQDQTPVLQSGALDAKVLFLASAEDEFEVLESNPDWVHVRISGLSRGWLRRSAVQLLDGSEAAAAITGPRTQSANANAGPTAASPGPFSVSSEETGNFPGNWEPLKGKSVKIVSVQAASGGQPSSAADKLNFAEEMFHKQSAPGISAGLVVIFDTEDGGMIAATSAQIAELKKGTISEEAFWKHCYVDPPELLGR